VIEDFNGDGNLDFAVTQRDVDSLTVWLGLGWGKIGAPARYPTGDFPVAIAAGDLNGDGRLDLVIANRDANTVTVYRGAGLGRFSNRVDYAVGSQPMSVAIATLDGDAHPDVAVCNFLSNSVSVLKGGFATGLNGSGFVVPTGTGPRGLAVADFNRDGLNDLITANETADSVSVIPNTVNGFAPRSDLAMPGDPTAVAVGDVTNDGWPDAVVAQYTPGYVTFLKNTNGTLAYELTYGAEANPDCVVIADVHGDSSPDIVVGHSTTTLVTVLTGGGTGQFTIPQSLPAPGSGVLALAAGDLDNDGINDIIAPSLTPALVAVFYADRHFDNGPFGGLGYYVIGQGGAGLATGDFNGDTFIDLAFTARSSGYAKTYWNDGNGVFPGGNRALPLRPMGGECARRRGPERRWVGGSRDDDFPDRPLGHEPCPRVPEPGQGRLRAVHGLRHRGSRAHRHGNRGPHARWQARPRDGAPGNHGGADPGRQRAR
jgi:hypothetical protein